MRSIMTLLWIVAGIYVALCGYMFAMQRSQIYYPTPTTFHPSAEAMGIENDGATLRVWRVSREGPKALIYFGGNAEDVSGNIDAFSGSFPDHSLYLVNYRGYGGSSGKPTESALLADAVVIFDKLRSHHAQIAVMGRSLGSGVATHVASIRDVEKLVLVTPFDSLAKVAQSHFRFLPVGALMLDRYDSASIAKNVAAPVLLVIAAEDEIVPRARSEALAGSFAPSQLKVTLVPNVSHNTLDVSPMYLTSVRRFLSE